MPGWEPFPLLAPRHEQTIVLPGDERIRRLNHKSCKDQLVTVPPNGARTLFENFYKGVELSKDLPCIGTYSETEKGYVWETYAKTAQRGTNVGSGLVKLGYKPREAHIGVYAKNCAEWIITELGCNSYTMVLVPLYDTLGPEAVKFIVEQAEISVVVVDTANTPLLLKQLKDLPHIKVIVKGGQPLTDEERATATECGVNMMHFSDLEKMGEESPAEHVPPEPEDIATIQYTSGTTGNPKGAMLSHRAMVADMAAAMTFITEILTFSNDDTHISYLPLAHSFERLITSIMWNAGARVGFYRGDTKLIIEDIKMLKPSLFISVPRLLNRVYDVVNQQVENGGFLRSSAFHFALRMKRRLVMQGVITNESVWDKLFFTKVQAALGGRLRGIISGAAPLSPTVMDWLRCTMGCVVVEGYGQTENAAAATVTLPGDPELHHVGPPLPCNEIKLIDVPEMNYFAKDGKGEICIRGGNVFSGYFKDPEKTKEALTEDGWLLSGDIGMWTESGTLRIIDRRKNIFKLAQGEYVAPERVEEVYSRVKGVAQVYLHGTSLEPACVAVVVPDQEVLRAQLTEKGINADGNDWLNSPEVRKFVLDELVAAGKAAKLKGFEQAKAVFLTPVEFTVDNDLLTPTFKAKRNKLREYFEKEIAAMYDDLQKVGSHL